MNKIDFGKKYIIQSKKLALGLGDLTTTQQHLFDLLTSNCAIVTEDSSIFDQTFKMPFIDIKHYLNIRGKRADKLIENNMNELSKADFYYYDKGQKDFLSMKIFKSIKLKDDVYLYTFNHDFLSYVVLSTTPQQMFNNF